MTIARYSWRALLVFAASFLAAASALPAQVYRRVDPAPFPHERHAKLFPTCSGCHDGQVTGDPSTVMPPASLCEKCHDGKTKPRVPYTTPTPRQDFLRFRHAAHASEVDTASRQCASCHATREGAPWMSVRRATPESCLGCHTHRASAHLANDNRCTTCHIPLAQSTTITAGEIDSLPKPTSHNDARYVSQHGGEAKEGVERCATCHARESCARCHVNASTLPAIQAMLPDARVKSLMRWRVASYPTPDDHRTEGWESAHRKAASGATATCATCHAQSSCTTCHIGELGRDVIRRLPDGRDGAPGVRLGLPPTATLSVPFATPVHAPTRATGQQRDAAGGLFMNVALRDTTPKMVRPHPDGFARNHAASAASGKLTCEGCHTQRFCADCHAGESKRAFHVANFVVRHAANSYSRDLDCAGCHNTEVFCRGCHQAQGIAARGRSGGTYHNGQPLWLLQHGQAARQGLEGCATCHAQRDCMKCHSQRGWGVSPHGDDFDATRLGARAKAMCARCHLTDPTRGR